MLWIDIIDVVYRNHVDLVLRLLNCYQIRVG